jgi:hypothetical protein
MDNKKYIYNIEEFNSINEEFLGKIAKNVWNTIKNSASKAYSKSFGSYSKIEKLFQEFEEKIMANFTEINTFRKRYIEALKQQLAGNTEINAATVKNIRNQIAQAEKKLENIKNNLYKQLDIKATNIIKDEKNPKVKELITLKKLEMEQRLEMMQYEAVKDGLDEEFIKAFPKTEEELGLPTQEELADISDNIERVTLALEGKGEDSEDSFNMEEAKKNPKYLWEKSPLLKSKDKLKEGEEILFFSKSDYETEKDKYTGTIAYISSDEQQEKETFDKDGNHVIPTDEQIYVSKDPKKLDSGFLINIGKIIKVGKEETKPTNQSSTANVTYSYAGN